MDIKTALTDGYNQLNTISPTPQLDAEVLLAFVIRQSRTYILTHLETKLDGVQIKKYQRLIVRRAQSEPTAYLTKQKEFYGRKFYVNKSVLIPRPESEQIIDLLKQYHRADEKLTIADIGTGSGCLAITAALEFPNCHVFALDISGKALAVARKNIKLHHATNITAGKSDLTQYLTRNNISPDILIANLPYLSRADFEDSPTKYDLQYEPDSALISDDNGLAHIKALIESSNPIVDSLSRTACCADLARSLYRTVQGSRSTSSINGLGDINIKNTAIYLEMLPRQVPIFIKWLNKNHPQHETVLPDDLNGEKRIVILFINPIKRKNVVSTPA